MVRDKCEPPCRTGPTAISNFVWPLSGNVFLKNDVITLWQKCWPGLQQYSWMTPDVVSVAHFPSLSPQSHWDKSFRYLVEIGLDVLYFLTSYLVDSKMRGKNWFRHVPKLQDILPLTLTAGMDRKIWKYHSIKLVCKKPHRKNVPWTAV